MSSVLAKVSIRLTSNAPTLVMLPKANCKQILIKLNIKTMTKTPRHIAYLRLHASDVPGRLVVQRRTRPWATHHQPRCCKVSGLGARSPGICPGTIC